MPSFLLHFFLYEFRNFLLPCPFLLLCFLLLNIHYYISHSLLCFVSFFVPVFFYFFLLLLRPGKDGKLGGYGDDDSGTLAPWMMPPEDPQYSSLVHGGMVASGMPPNMSMGIPMGMPLTAAAAAAAAAAAMQMPPSVQMQMQMQMSAGMGGAAYGGAGGGGGQVVHLGGKNAHLV
jgi:hypothetical protein